MVTTLPRRGARPARRPTLTVRRTAPRLEALETRMLLSSGLQPTAQDQLLLQELNAIRANPTAYGQSIGLDLSNVAPSQPLAFNTLLDSAAQAHSQDMNDQNYFAHITPAGQGPDARMSAAGFNWYAWGESIAAGFTSTDSVLRALIVDQGIPDLGHRIQLLAMSSLFQGQNQVGIGIASGSGTYGTYYTIDTAQAAGNANSFATGVVYNDANSNAQYDVGEGMGGVTVTANNGATTTTFGSGGYSLQLGPGTYTLTFSGGSLSSPVTRSVTIGKQNIEVDVTNPPASAAPPVVVAPPIAPPPVAAPPVTGPTLAPISDQSISNATGSAQIGISASDAAGRAITYQVSVQGNGLPAAIQQLNLHEDSSGFHQNSRGQNEKWLIGSGNALWGWYEVLQDGTVRPWFGGNSYGAAVATLGASAWANPLSLTSGSAGNAAGITGSVNGNTLTLSGLQNYSGTLQVNVTASDGVGSVSRSFNVNVSSTPLTLAPIANVTAAHGGPVQINLSSTDAANRTVNYQVQTTGDSPAYDLEQKLGLQYTGDLLQNAVGLNEKWLQSSTSNLANYGWYAILPDGEIRPWDGGTGTLATVARLSSAVYADPSLLYSATAPTAGASFSGSVLTLSPPGNFVGTLQVTVTASDGTSSTSRQFSVNMT
jgi:uncharacterized protein YkwD